jgi:hypothetical protein
MGLDITAYEFATPLPAHERGDACWDNEGHRPTYVYAGMEHSFRGIEITGYDDNNEFAYGPCMRTSGEIVGFHAGSYSGHSGHTRFRNALCQAVLKVEPPVVWASPASYADKPFYELINFADNEGTIGPEVCADLARDFVEHRQQFEESVASSPDATWLRQKYDDWQRAFQLTAGHGIVDFH